MSIQFTNVQMRTANRIKAFNPINSNDKKRKQKAIEMLTIDVQRLNDGVPTDCGLYGKVDELLNHDSFSTCYKPRSNKYHDIDPWINGERVKAENKTNGGRIEKLYRMKDKHNRFIVYTIDYIVPIRFKKDGSPSGGEYRHVSKIMRVDTFLNLIESVNAIKVIQHNGYDVNDAERAVQGDSKKLYKALKNGGYTDFNPNRNYLDNEII